MMKTLTLLMLLCGALFMSSCDNKPPKDCALLTIKTEDSSIKEIRAQVGRKMKVLKRNSQGEFRDTIHFKKKSSDQILLFSSNMIRFVYVEKNKSVVMNVKGDDLSMATFDKDLEKENNLFTKVNEELKQNRDKYNKIETIQKAKEEVDQFLNKYKKEAILISKDPNYQRIANRIFSNNATVAIILPVEAKIQNHRITEGDLAPGKPAPKFSNYENINGGKTSMDDFKGKYLLIELSSVTCCACKRQIKPIRKLKKRYHDKNIEFVNISISRKKFHDKWAEMVKKDRLSINHLFTNGDQSLLKAYATNSFPSFILIDPQGNIVTAKAPKATDSKIIELLDSVL
ncbi:TlpA disulfide reductase family protein [Prolixibacteraceae bacterium]|nr:TlpA disulfide reductase family protein [Prolixibacteraceae bacterium]